MNTNTVVEILRSWQEPLEEAAIATFLIVHVWIVCFIAVLIWTAIWIAAGR